MPWYCTQDVGTTGAGDLYYLMHMYYRENEVQSNFYHPVIKPLIDIIKPLSLIRAKGKLYPSTHKIFRHEEHVDYAHPHKGFLYYINTNNGFTILENGKLIAHKTFHRYTSRRKQGGSQLAHDNKSGKVLPEPPES